MCSRTRPDGLAHRDACWNQNANKQAMYAVVHGGLDQGLRRESLEYLTSLPFDGLAIGTRRLLLSLRRCREVCGRSLRGASVWQVAVSARPRTIWCT